MGGGIPSASHFEGNGKYLGLDTSHWVVGLPGVPPWLLELGGQGAGHVLGEYVSRVVLHKVIQINIFLQDNCTWMCSPYTQDHGSDLLEYKFACSC